MSRRVGWTLSCFLLVGAGGAFPPGLQVRNVPLTRVIRIPAVLVSSTIDVASAEEDNTNLLISPGAPDELPEGPEGFDVLDDGTLLITDPLRNRLAAFDSQGHFKRDWNIGFAADSVTAAPGGLILVREASTGDLHAFDRDGRLRSVDSARLSSPGEARLLAPNRGVILRPRTAAAGPLEVRFDRAGFRLLSLEELVRNNRGETYVALETTAGGEAVDVSKSVRRYNAQDQLVAEIEDMKVDYYVRPVDELRVHQGFVYQLMSSQTQVSLNVWDTN